MARRMATRRPPMRPLIRRDALDVGTCLRRNRVCRRILSRVLQDSNLVVKYRVVFTVSFCLRSKIVLLERSESGHPWPGFVLRHCQGNRCVAVANTHKRSVRRATRCAQLFEHGVRFSMENRRLISCR